MTNLTSKRFAPDAHTSHIIRRYAEPYTGEAKQFDSLLSAIGNKSMVLLGEASHGTHEFYKTRIDLSKRLIEEKRFNVIAIEADWPDAWQVNKYVKGQSDDKSALEALSGFKRFPTWLWRNADVLSFIEWLKKYNDSIARYEDKVSFVGLDLYSLYRSAQAVVDYLEPINKEAAERARLRYSCLLAYGADEQAYGYAASLGLAHSCEENVIAELIELRQREFECLKHDGRIACDEYFFAEQNARLVAKAQAYYREMFKGRINTWNLRDTHMAETLIDMKQHMTNNGQGMKAVVWAHNSHLGDASATDMRKRGEFNLGQLVREHFENDCFLLGFSGYTGTVTAASSWGGPAERKRVVPGMTGSYEALFHTVNLPSFILNLKQLELVQAISGPHLQRAIGVIYLPQTERVSHYFFSRLPDQFDAIIHFQDTQAVEPLEKTALWKGGPERVEETID